MLRLTETAMDKPSPESEISLEARLVEEMQKGQSLREAMAALVDQGEKKNQVYAASLRLKELL